MSSITIALIIAGCSFGGAMLGLVLQGLLPGHHLSDGSRDTVRLGAGMIATLTALILGLLVSSAKSSFDSVNTGIMQASAKMILLDRTLARYGPEAQAAREQLKRAIAVGVEKLWPTVNTGVAGLSSFERTNGMELLEDRLRELKPGNDNQRQLLSQAQQMTADLMQTKWLVIEQAQNALPTMFLVLLGFWLTTLFVTIGLFSPRNGTVIVVLLVCAVSMSAAIFLILEMNQPLSGMIRVSNAPLLKALEQFGK